MNIFWGLLALVVTVCLPFIPSARDRNVARQIEKMNEDSS